MFYRLSGCITKITSDGLRLTLTAEDYAKFRENRKRLFWRLQDDFYEILINYGETLFEENQIYEEDTDWIKFGKYITLNTFNIYFFKSINYIEDRYTTFGDLFIAHPILEEINNRYTNYTQQYNDEINDYRKSLLTSFY